MNKATKFIINMILIITITFGMLMLVDKAIEKEDTIQTYSKEGIVQEIDNDLITVIDNEGMLWTYYGSNVKVGNEVTLIMQGNNSIEDKIISVIVKEK